MNAVYQRYEDLAPEDRERIGRICKQYLADRSCPSPPPIEHYRKELGSNDLTLLVELILTDQDFRHGPDYGPADILVVEDYLALYPALAAESEALGLLIQREHSLRVQRDDPNAAIEQYLQRFPEQRERIEAWPPTTPGPWLVGQMLGPF